MSIAQTMRSTSGTNHAYVRRRVRSTGEIAHGGSLINRRYASVITSRGCPAECFFCSAHGSMGYKFRYRSVENVLAEIDELVKTYQIGEILFEDDNLTMHRERHELRLTHSAS